MKTTDSWMSSTVSQTPSFYSSGYGLLTASAKDGPLAFEIREKLLYSWKLCPVSKWLCEGLFVTPRGPPPILLVRGLFARGPRIVPFFIDSDEL